ncbi:hypothetical protein LXA58_17860, partial [Erwinia amylovora]|uniref:hypothetical protein n=1 Tax=Erwinia amylovora TaxID=552 RepID=UPI0020C0CD18
AEESFQGQSHPYLSIHLFHGAGGTPFTLPLHLLRLCAGLHRPDRVVVQDMVWTPAEILSDLVLPLS